MGLVQGVTRSGLVCQSPYGMASEGQEERISGFALRPQPAARTKTIENNQEIVAAQCAGFLPIHSESGTTLDL